MFYIYLHYFLLSIPGSEFGNKNSFAKKSVRSEDNRQLQAETFLGFVKCFGEFAKGIYEICSRNYFNLALIVFSIVQFILFYVLLAIISEEP